MDPEAELTSMNVSLPRAQMTYVEEQSARTGCSTASEYIRRLIHEDQLRQEREALDRKLADALRSGPGVEITPVDWAEIHTTACTRLKERQRSK